MQTFFELCSKSPFLGFFARKQQWCLRMRSFVVCHVPKRLDALHHDLLAYGKVSRLQLHSFIPFRLNSALPLRLCIFATIRLFALAGS